LYHMVCQAAITCKKLVFEITGRLSLPVLITTNCLAQNWDSNSHWKPGGDDGEVEQYSLKEHKYIRDMAIVIRTHLSGCGIA